MNVWLMVPILAGILIGYLINYLSDVLPDTLLLGVPICKNAECGRPYSWRDYLLLRRCPHCGRKRGPRSAMVLVIAEAASIYVWLKPPIALGYALGLIALAYLLLVAIIDLEHRLILRPLSIAGLVLGVAAGWIAHGWQAMLIGGAAGFAIMFIFYLFGKLFTLLRARRLGQDPRQAEEALGSGDVTLATILGLLLGWPLIWFGLLAGVLIAGVVSAIIVLALVFRRNYREQAFMVFIPFGPAFVLSAIVLIYLPNWITAALPG
jgi:leader peptidase (prepilin peptidase)/N-methyltransferase